jgi:hypothetical protein
MPNIPDSVILRNKSNRQIMLAQGQLTFGGAGAKNSWQTVNLKDLKDKQREQIWGAIVMSVPHTLEILTEEPVAVLEQVTAKPIVFLNPLVKAVDINPTPLAKVVVPPVARAIPAPVSPVVATPAVMRK